MCHMRRRIHVSYEEEVRLFWQSGAALHIYVGAYECKHVYTTYICSWS
jgi:hypothetical protein